MTQGDKVSVVRASSKGEVEIVADLFREYQRTIGTDLCFQGFEQELASLPGEYSPPFGELFLAQVGDAIAGCVALRKLSDEVCEMKRLYVRDAFKGHRLGRLLAERAIGAGRRIGYRKMRLDTLPTMRAAISLYESLGFAPIPAYRHNPVPGSLFFELKL